MALKHVNSKYQSKETIYILLVLAIKAILLVFLKHVSPVLEEKKTGCGKAMKNSAGCGIFVKKEEEIGIRP